MWKHHTLWLLKRIRCVFMKAGAEIRRPQGRHHLPKRCNMSTQNPADLPADAKRPVPFVQADLTEPSDCRRLTGEAGAFGWKRARKRGPAPFAETSGIKEERPRSLPEREIEVHR